MLINALDTFRDAGTITAINYYSNTPCVTHSVYKSFIIMQYADASMRVL